MKTLLTLVSCLFLTFVFSQKETLIKQTLLKNINQFRTSKNLGVFESNPKTDSIAYGVYNIFGTVEPMMLMNELGIEKEWAIYHVESFSFSIQKNINNTEKINKHNNDKIDQYTKNYIYDTTLIKNCEWYYKSNFETDEPYLFGVYVVKTNSDDYYETYRIFFITLKNIPMEYKCFRPIKN
jgi:hypothetical protein